MITARTRDTAPPEQTTAPATPVTLTDPHDYQIDWTGGQIVYRVDNTVVATHTPPATPGMTVQASDFDDSFPLPLESITYRKPGTGTYTSKVLDGGDARVTGLTFTPATAATPAGTTVTYQAQSSSSAAGPWSAFTAPANTPPARFVRYRAVLSSTNAETPRLTGASVDFRIDSVAPAVKIGAVSVSGTTASVPFSSDDAKATYRCSLDGGVFAPCSTPAQFGSLSVGTHAVAVRARDAVGNERTASASFTVSAPQGSAPDVKAPKLALPRSARVSGNGKVKLRLSCPADETSCTVKVSLRRNGKTLAKKTLKIDGGDSRTVSLRLSKAIRRLVADRGALRVKLAISASDDAGNRSSKTKGLTLKAAAA